MSNILQTRPAKAPQPKAPTARRMTPAQAAVAPLAPIFAACKLRGLQVTPDNREARLRAVNRYFNWLPFDWIELSFKELLTDRAAVLVVADAIEAGVLAW